MTTVTAFNMQDKLAEDYKQASEVFTIIVACGAYLSGYVVWLENEFPIFSWLVGRLLLQSTTVLPCRSIPSDTGISPASSTPNASELADDRQ